MGEPRGSLAVRLWRHVHKTRTCWLWTGYTNKDRYGILRGTDGRPITAHRAAWIVTHGPIADDLCVCHTCDVRHCVRPSHLFLGTHADNMRDATAKGHRARGERNSNARFTTEQVAAARSAHADGRPIAALARDYGVAFNAMWQIVNRRTWKHVP